MPVITAARVRTLIPDLTGTGEDTTLEALIDVADRQIAAHLGVCRNDAGIHTLASSTYTLREPDLSLDADGRIIWPDAANITAVTSLHSDPDEAFGADTLVDSATYVLNTRAGFVRLKPSATALSTEPGAVKLVITAGWSSLDDALEQAVAMQTRHLFTLRRQQGQSSVSEAGVSVSLRDETIPDVVRQMVAPFRVRGL